jgi:hypothetical protein
MSERKLSALEAYYKQEEKKGFKDWTRSGLVFLLNVEESELTEVQRELVTSRLETM